MLRPGRGTSFDTSVPPLPFALALAAGAAAPRVAFGAKRNAVFGTSSTSRRSSAVMVDVAVMPGRRLESALSTSRTVT
jgi:hypothetical protein